MSKGHRMIFQHHSYGRLVGKPGEEVTKEQLPEIEKGVGEFFNTNLTYLSFALENGSTCWIPGQVLREGLLFLEFVEIDDNPR